MPETLHISPWVAVALALPILLLGEWIVRRVRVLDRFNIPEPVVGGLLVALLILLGNVSGLYAASFDTNVTARWWTWIVCTHGEWLQVPEKSVNQPFLVAFFACIGLNASWTLVKRGSLQVLLFLGLALTLCIMQNVVGLVVAGAMGVPQVTGLVCGSVAMTGGHGTVMGFASEFEKAGLSGAAVVGVAAATFGLVAGGLIGGPLASRLIKRYALGGELNQDDLLVANSTRSGSIVIFTMSYLWRFRALTLKHLVLILVCVKLGAWVSYWLQYLGITFPVYMGALLLGVVVRNVLDVARPRWVQTRFIDKLSTFLLGIFLSIAMMSLNLIELAGVAGPMLVILTCQVALMLLFARYITFNVMGRDYDAAVMAAGYCGFGLGAMPNAIANMQAVTERYGYAARAFLVLPITGTFLIDIFNATNITVFLNLVR